MQDLEDHAAVASSQLADLAEVVVLQLAHFLLLREERLQTLPLLLVQLQLLQLLLEGLQVRPEGAGGTQMEAGSHVRQVQRRRRHRAWGKDQSDCGEAPPEELQRCCWSIKALICAPFW